MHAGLNTGFRMSFSLFERILFLCFNRFIMIEKFLKQFIERCSKKNVIFFLHFIRQEVLYKKKHKKTQFFKNDQF